MPSASAKVFARLVRDASFSFAAGMTSLDPANLAHHVSQRAQVFDRDVNPVAGNKPWLTPLRIAGCHPFRRASEDQISCEQRHVSRDVAHQRTTVKDHVAGIRRLAK